MPTAHRFHIDTAIHRGWIFPHVRTRILSQTFHDDSCQREFDIQALDRTPEARRRRRLRLGREVSLLLSILLVTMFLIGCACAQDRPTAAVNEFGLWFDGQSGNGHAFGSTTNSRMYELEVRYSRLVYTNHLYALRYVAEVVPLSAVGQPEVNGQRVYAYGGGGSPIGAQINFLHDRRVQPFLTSGGGFLCFNRRMFGASSTLPPKLGRASKYSRPGTTALTLATNIITFLTPTGAASTRAWTRTWCS